MMAYLLGSGVALGCLYMIGKELLPSRMSANHLFNEAFDVVKADHEVDHGMSACHEAIFATPGCGKA